MFQGERIVKDVSIGIWTVDGIECTDINGLWALMKSKNPAVDRPQAQTAASMYTDSLCKVPVSDTSSVMKTLLTLESVLEYLSKYSPRGARSAAAVRRWIVTATKEQIDKVSAQFGLEFMDLTEYSRLKAQNKRDRQLEETERLIRQIKENKHER